MKTKLEMAHEWYIVQVRRNGCALVTDAWKYADAMQAEADKRENKETCDKSLNIDSKGLNVEEWQPDWSVVPNGYDWFIVGGRSGKGFFCLIEPKIIKDLYWFVGEDCLSVDKHDYQGDWRDSLRKRPN